MKKLLLTILLCFTAAEIWFFASSMMLGPVELGRLVLVPAAGLLMTVGCLITFVLGHLLLRLTFRSSLAAFSVAGAICGSLIFAISVAGYASNVGQPGGIVLLQYAISGLCWGSLYAACCMASERVLASSASEPVQRDSPLWTPVSRRH